MTMISPRKKRRSLQRMTLSANKAKKKKPKASMTKTLAYILEVAKQEDHIRTQTELLGEDRTFRHHSK